MFAGLQPVRPRNVSTNPALRRRTTVRLLQQPIWVRNDPDREGSLYPYGRWLREADDMRSSIRKRVTDIVVGAILGFAVGAIIAVNVVITAGVDRGYEASIPEIFEENTLLGVVTVAILAAGPIIGVIITRRLRRRSEG